MLPTPGVRILVIALLASGCVIGEDGTGGDDGELGPNGRPIRPVPTNGLVLDAALAAQLPVTGLGTRGEGGAVVLAPAADAAFASDAGRALLRYATICALAPEDELVAGGDRFAGFYGLAPEWASGACGDACQRWVSACLLAHANANGTPFEISLRGDHPALAAGDAARAELTYQEAAYYGNVFQRDLHACWGADAGHASPSDAERFLAGRVCGQVYGECGLVTAGPCAHPSAAEIAACRRPAPDGGGFADCHTGDLGEYPRSSPVIREVVTVYLRP